MVGKNIPSYTPIRNPPWRYEHPAIGSKSKAIENHYPTMLLEDIKKLKVRDIADDNCVLFLWATAPKLKECIEVMVAWGFEYRTCAIWDKKTIGVGYWFRNQHELLLIGKIGKFSPPEPKQRVSSVYQEKKSEHSKKPTFFRNLISEWYPDKNKIELFARKNDPVNLWGKSSFDNWDLWGNEIKSDIEL